MLANLFAGSCGDKAVTIPTRALWPSLPAVATRRARAGRAGRRHPDDEERLMRKIIVQ